MPSRGPLVLRAAGFTVVLQLPFKVLAGHLVEHHVKGFVELVQPANHVRVNGRVSSPFGLAKAPGGAAVLRLLQAGKPFSLIEVKVFVCDDPLQSQEVLHFGHLPRGVHNQPLAADKVHLGEGEILHPALQVERIYSDTQGAPRGVNETQRPVLKSQNLKGGDLGFLGQSLRVVRDGSGDGITHHYDKLDIPGHGVDALRGMVSHKVAGCLLHGDLPLQRGRHQVSGNTDSRRAA